MSEHTHLERSNLVARVSKILLGTLEAFLLTGCVSTRHAKLAKLSGHLILLAVQLLNLSLWTDMWQRATQSSTARRSVVCTGKEPKATGSL